MIGTNLESFISTATMRNWHKLDVKNHQTKLTKRANKKRSIKRIFPMEYISNECNIESINLLLTILLISDILLLMPYIH